jgi:hypothetical protein
MADGNVFTRKIIEEPAPMAAGLAASPLGYRPSPR